MIALSGCASIIDGSEQSISIVTTTQAMPIDGATCTLSNGEGMWTVISPGTATVHRGTEDLQVRCDLNGFASGVINVPSKTSWTVFGDVLLGGPLAAVHDRNTGEGFRYPDLATVEMGRRVFEAPDVGQRHANQRAEPNTAYLPPQTSDATNFAPVVENPDGTAYKAGTTYFAPW